jgi:hypothetical protein
MIVISLYGWGRALSAFRAGAKDPYRDVARFARTAIPRDAAVVTSGLVHLEVLSQFDREWRPPLQSLPAEQAMHPGWRARAAAGALASEVAALARVRERFFWIGEAGSPELHQLERLYLLRPVYRSGDVVVAVAIRKPDGAV